MSELSYDEWCKAHSGACNLNGLTIARVSAVDRSLYTIRDGEDEWQADLSGRFLHEANGADAFPCVGDWVAVEKNESQRGRIHSVLPRKTILRRKSAGASSDNQIIAANIDLALVVQSASFDFNLRRLDRYIVMCLNSGIQPVVLLTKADLVSEEELQEKLSSVTLAGAVSIAIGVSVVTGLGIEEVRNLLLPGKTFCLLGSSGVGKTSLINRLLGRDLLATGEVSGTGEGTHTTRRRQLLQLESGAMIIDTPGMRELGVANADLGVDLGFQDIQQLAVECRFSNCHHQQEMGCAIRAAIETGVLDEDRLLSYLKLQRESDRQERLQKLRQRQGRPGKYAKKNRGKVTIQDETY